MSKIKIIPAIAMAGLFGAACQDPVNSTIVQPYRAELKVGNGIWPNGIWPNGIWPNGIWPNGIWPNGVPLEGVSLDGLTLSGQVTNGVTLTGHISGGITIAGIAVTSPTLNGVPITDVSLSGNQVIAGILGSRDHFSGATLKGLSLQVSIPDPAKGPSAKFSIRIDDAYLDPLNQQKDVWLFQTSYKPDGAKTWSSLCLDYAGNPAPLTPVWGSYWDGKTGNRIDDSKSFTLACSEGAVAKCLSAGYRPWATASQCDGTGKSKKCVDVSLQDYHQACTRMLRADYCGDGTPHTINGTILDIFDYLSPPVQLQEEKWQMEARWTPDGAICVSQRRHPEIPFPGCPKVTDKKKPASLVQPPTCQPYSTGDDRGLIVSTFNSMPVAP